MRALLVAAIAGETAINNLPSAVPPGEGVQGRIYQASALGEGLVPAVPEKPFILIKEELANSYAEVRGSSTAKLRSFQIHVNDHKGSYLRIDRILGLVEDLTKSLAGEVSATGARCLEVGGWGVSGDLFDPEYDAIVRYGFVRLTASR